MKLVIILIIMIFSNLSFAKTSDIGFISLEELKKSFVELMSKEKKHRTIQNERLEDIYKKNSDILLELKPYILEDKPIAIFTYAVDGCSEYRAFAIFEEKIITFSSKKSKTQIEIFREQSSTISQYSEIKDLMTFLRSNKEILLNSSGYYSPMLTLGGSTYMLSIFNDTKYDSFVVEGRQTLEKTDLRYLICKKLMILYKELHPKSQVLSGS